MSLRECAYSPEPSLLGCEKYGFDKVSDKYLDLWPQYDTSWTCRYDRLKEDFAHVYAISTKISRAVSFGCCLRSHATIYLSCWLTV